MNSLWVHRLIIAILAGLATYAFLACSNETQATIRSITKSYSTPTHSEGQYESHSAIPPDSTTLQSQAGSPATQQLAAPAPVAEGPPTATSRYWTNPVIYRERRCSVELSSTGSLSDAQLQCGSNSKCLGIMRNRNDKEREDAGWHQLCGGQVATEVSKDWDIIVKPGLEIHGSPVQVVQDIQVNSGAPSVQSEAPVTIASPRMFTQRRGDGLGAQQLQIIAAFAVAHHTGLNFGGFYQPGHPDSYNHRGVEMVPTLVKWFGIKDWKPFFLSDSELPKFTKVCQSISPGMREDPVWKCLRDASTHSAFPPAAVRVDWRPGLWNTGLFYTARNLNGVFDKYFTPSFLEMIRKQTRPLLQRERMKVTPGRHLVAIHVRRGELREKAWSWQSNEWYYDLIDRIRKLLPTADIHVWSSYNSTFMRTFNTGVSVKEELATFDGFRNRNVTLHLDDEYLPGGGDALWAAVQFAVADVLVMAKSAMSYVSALYNEKCVVYVQQGERPKLAAWVDGEDQKRRGFDDELRECISRIPKVDSVTDSPGSI